MRKSSDSFKPLKREKKRDAAKEEEVEMASLEGDESIRGIDKPFGFMHFNSQVLDYICCAGHSLAVKRTCGPRSLDQQKHFNNYPQKKQSTHGSEFYNT